MIHVETGDVHDPLSNSDTQQRQEGSDDQGYDEGPINPRKSVNDDDADSKDENEESQADNFASYGQLVGPPSYEESVMYESVVHAGGEGEEEAVSTKGPPLTISVSDPQRRELQMIVGMKSGYIQYKVMTISRLSSYGSPEKEVRRRFREFVSLSEVLKARFRGYFLPPRPEKNAVEGQRMKDSFIEERRVLLEKYLNRLAAHPVVGPSEELRLFLETDGDLGGSYQWQKFLPAQANFLEGTAKLSKQLFGRESSVPQPGDVAQPSKKTNDYLRRMKEGFQSMKQELSGAARNSDVDEKELKLQTKVVEGTWDNLAETSRVAEKLVRKFERMGAVYGDLGLSFIKLSKYEETEGTDRAAFTDTVSCAQSITSDTMQAGVALVRLARLAKKVTGKMAQDLGELHDYLYFMPAVLKALATREQALLTLQTLEAQYEARAKLVEDLDNQASLVVGGDRGKVRKANDVRNEINTLEHSIQAARAEYDKLKKVNRDELSRFQSQKKKDFTAMLHSLACVQAAYAERSSDVWLMVAKELGATEEQLYEAKTVPVQAGIRFD
ncbi:hypothetical protein BSKO_06861 [Bryopsis sp. KO-2023]|nr:hypothetical protein BSKO_06861 [Bryopsis sp. KO-2023]